MEINFLEKIILLQISSSIFAGDLKSSGLLCVISREIKSNQTKHTQLRQANATLDQNHATQIAALDSLFIYMYSEVPNERADRIFFWKFSKYFGIIREAQKC